MGINDEKNAQWRKQGNKENEVCKKCPKVNLTEMLFLIQPSNLSLDGAMKGQIDLDFMSQNYVDNKDDPNCSLRFDHILGMGTRAKAS